MEYYLFILGRILFGGFFIISGLRHFTQTAGMAGYAKSKGVPMAKLAILGSGALILLGGLGVLLGIYIQFSLILIAIFLIPVTFTMHAYWRDTDEHMRNANKINFGKNLGLLGAALILFSIWNG